MTQPTQAHTPSPWTERTSYQSYTPLRELTDAFAPAYPVQYLTTTPSYDSLYGDEREKRVYLSWDETVQPAYVDSLRHVFHDRGLASFAYQNPEQSL